MAKAEKIIDAAISSLFIAAEAALYIAFMCFDLGADGDLAVKYSGVILCAVFALFCCKRPRPDSFLLFAALVFTVISDWFLLITGENIEVGLATFIIAQLLHFARIYSITKARPFITLAARAVLCVIAIVVLAALSSLTLLTALAAVYFINLIINFADSVFLAVKDRRYIVYAAGLLLFICCDICVGAYNFSDAISVELPEGLVSFAAKGMWAFYLPSQTLIALSGEIK